MTRDKEAKELGEYKNFARRQGRLLGETPIISSAIVEFTAMEFLVNQLDVTPELREVRANEIVHKLALSNDEVVHARKLAMDAYGAYRAVKGIATPDEIQDFSPEATWMYKEDPTQRKRERQQAKQQARKRELRGRLESSYKELMSLSDDELRTQNSNQRVDFRSDVVYQDSYRNRQQAFKARSLTSQQYKAAGGNVSDAEDILQLKRKGLGDADLIARVAESLEANKAYRTSFEGQKFLQFKSLVLALLTGEILPASQIRSLGFDPNEVLHAARVRHADSYAEKHAQRRDIRRKPEVYQ